MKWTREPAIELFERGAELDEPIIASRETAWEALLCEIFEGLRMDDDGRIDLDDVAARLRSGLAADKIIVLEESAEPGMRVAAMSGAVAPSLTAPLRRLARLATTHGYSEDAGAVAVAAGSRTRAVIVAQGMGYCGLSEVEQRAVMRCLAGWLAGQMAVRTKVDQSRARFQERKYQGLSHFAVRVAHEFRNTLAAVLSQTEFVLDRVDENHIVHQNLEDVVLAAREAATNVDALMMFGGLLDRPPPEPIDLGQQLQGMCSVLRALIPEAIDFSTSVAPGCSAGIQPVHLRQMLVNLVANAAESIGPQMGSIAIEVDAESEQRVVLKVVDDGPGMASAVLSRAADPFFSTRKGNRGLGLSVALGIARGYGGSLSIQSEPKVGTCVSVYLSKHACPPGRIV